MVAGNVSTILVERKHTVDQSKLHVTSVFSKTGAQAVVDHPIDEDEEILIALGYKQEFKRYVQYNFLARFYTHRVEIGD
jgi:hypothetical protein